MPLSCIRIPSPVSNPQGLPCNSPRLSFIEQGDEEKVLMERYYGYNRSSGTYLEIGALVRQCFRPALAGQDMLIFTLWPACRTASHIQTL